MEPKIQLQYDNQGRLTHLRVDCKAGDFSETMLELEQVLRGEKLG